MDNCLKPGWRMVKFGDMAFNVAERIDPAKAETDVYVGLEHLDPETIHLKKWGHPSDVTGQKLVFKKGDVIFGRRRAYQRKLALAECDGICSAHAMVVRAKPEMILPEFLPFFLQSDMFMERAIDISVGSLSPTINWKTLRVQEFPLPPIEEQKRIAEILWAADEVVEKWCEVYEKTETSFSVTRNKIFLDLATSNETVRLEKVGRWLSGGTPARSNKELWGGTFPWVSPKDMKVDVISDSEEKLTERALKNRITILPKGSILVVVRGMILAHTFPVAMTGTEVSFNQDMKGIIPDNRFLALFLYHWLKDKSSRILQVVEESTHGTKRLATDVLYRMEIPCPSLAEQEQSLNVFESFQLRLSQVAAHIKSSKDACRFLRDSQIGASNV